MAGLSDIGSKKAPEERLLSASLQNCVRPIQVFTSVQPSQNEIFDMS